jgi:hypothetical protein
MAEDAVSRELFSAKFPANREKYREICALNRTALKISADKEVLWPEKVRVCNQSEHGSIGERTGSADSILRGFWRLAPILR